MGQALEKRTCRDDNRAAPDLPPIHQMNAARAAVLDDQRGDLGLLDVQIRLALQNLLHADAVLLLVALRAR